MHLITRNSVFILNIVFKYLLNSNCSEALLLNSKGKYNISQIANANNN